MTDIARLLFLRKLGSVRHLRSECVSISGLYGELFMHRLLVFRRTFIGLGPEIPT